MKKMTALLLAGILLLSLLAGCSGGAKNDDAKNDDADFVWTREGSFEDGNENHLLITKSEEPGYEGWAVTFMKGGTVCCWKPRTARRITSRRWTFRMRPCSSMSI